MSEEYWPAPDWKFIGTFNVECKHLWKQEPREQYYSQWAYVTDGFDYYEFRQCVVCDSKQIREPES